MACVLRRTLPAALVWAIASTAPGSEAIFVRGINLNGPVIQIDGREWAGGSGPEIRVTGGRTMENQAVELSPPAGRSRATMIRSSVWGTDVGVEIRDVPSGVVQVMLYVWEDTSNERFDLFLNGRRVVEGFQSGKAGTWRKLGPWLAESDGTLRLEAKGGAANLSGVEIWQGDGPIPASNYGFVSPPTPEQTAFFEQRIRPVLVTNCYECHSTQSQEPAGGLLLDSRAGVIRGGDSGPVIVPGEPEESQLVRAVRHADPALTMPPEKTLQPEEIGFLEEWIRMGVPDPRSEDTVAVVAKRKDQELEDARNWWAFRPVVDPPVPQVRRSDWPISEIDHFILARLENAGLEPSADAGRATLLRRVSFDLTGLPPDPVEMEQFLNDAEPGAFERVVDRLLASPHYGERWGRHWLDVVRYADTAGDNSDFPIPQAHRYRDWVIDAFNRDLPYDEFVRDQLAGDLRPGATPEETRDRLIATGYIAGARRFGSRVDDYPWHLTIEDTIDNLGRAFLGLTVNCARCHDHKFDPVTTADYYGLYGIFASTRYPWPGIELEQRQRDFVPLASPEEVERAEAEHREKRRPLEDAVHTLEEQLKAAGEEREQERLRESLEAAKESLARHDRSPPAYERVYAVADLAVPQDSAIHVKGDPARPGKVVPRRFLSVLSGTPLPPDEHGSGRRQLAEWILNESNPLSARVMVNRIWMHHFGQGLVATPNDFGRQGRLPTHPELLDWLAVRFRESGWSIKSMHKRILLSRTWRISGIRSPESLTVDPANELLSAYPRRRLDAESIRDTLLMLGGNLDRERGGSHPFPPPADWKFTQHHPFKAIYETSKRSVYLMTQRIQRHPFLAIFDGADPSTSTPVRPVSTTPLQALFLLNDPFVHDQAAGFAGRVLKGPECSTDDRLARAWKLAFARPVEPEELQAAAGYLDVARRRLEASGLAGEALETEVWTSLARVIFRMNELVYID